MRFLFLASCLSDDLRVLTSILSFPFPPFAGSYPSFLSDHACYVVSPSILCARWLRD